MGILVRCSCNVIFYISSVSDVVYNMNICIVYFIYFVLARLDFIYFFKVRLLMVYITIFHSI